MLKIGEKIPNLDLITHKGEKINLHDFKGKKIVLFFYPRANTPGCTACLLYTSPSPRDS